MNDHPCSDTIDEITGLPRVLLAALEQTRSSTCITTADLDLPGPTIVYVNPAYCRMTGRRRDDVIGTTPRVMQGPLTDRSVLDRLRCDLSEGRRFSGETVNYREDGTPFIINWSIDPVHDASGAVTHFVATQEDVTSAVRLGRRVAAEAALDKALTWLLTVPGESRWALQHLADQIADEATTIAAVGEVSVTVYDVDDDTASTAGVQRTTGRSQTFEFARVGSRTKVTLSVAGMSVDESAFLDHEGLSEYTTRAGNGAAALMEYQRQRQTALRLQLALLPPDTESVPGLEIATKYVPGAAGMHVGGDWFDVVATDDRIVLSVGDVAGSGADAASLMGRLRLLASVAIERGRSVSEVLDVLDEMCEREGELATIELIELDPESGVARIWSAGHLPPILLGNSETTSVPVDTAPPLGHLRGATPSSIEVTLGAGEALMLYTDGLIERRDEPITDGMARLVDALGDRGPLASAIETALAVCGSEQVDDVAVLAVRRLE